MFSALAVCVGGFGKVILKFRSIPSLMQCDAKVCSSVGQECNTKQSNAQYVDVGFDVAAM